MSIELQCDKFPLSQKEVSDLWQVTCKQREYEDELVTVACVSEEKSQELNRQYRKQDKPTNVLTFSYGLESDVALCLQVARAEAARRQQAERDYVALLLVHAFLHVTGLDHEDSPAAESEMKECERVVLRECGFEVRGL